MLLLEISVVYSVFFPRSGELLHNTGENKFTDFRKANEPVKCNFIFKYSLKTVLAKKAQEKILNPPKTANNHPIVVLEIYILHAYMSLHEMNLCAKFSKFLFRRTSLPHPKFRPPKTDTSKMDNHALWITQRSLGCCLKCSFFNVGDRNIPKPNLTGRALRQPSCYRQKYSLYTSLAFD